MTIAEERIIALLESLPDAKERRIDQLLKAAALMVGPPETLADLEPDPDLMKRIVEGAADCAIALLKEIERRNS